MLEQVAIALSITALLAYVNHRFIGLPNTIGIMSIALLLSLSLSGLRALGWGELHGYVVTWMSAIDFTDLLMQGMLSILLFAGALHVDLSELRSYGLQIGLLAVLGTVASTVLVGLALWWVLPLAGLALPLAWCLVFGALISPTDPIAVLGILKSANAPPSLEIVIAGESLFNDGVGVVLFALLVGMLGHDTPTLAEAGTLLLHEGVGGLAFGLVLGYIAYYLLGTIDSYQEEVLITLATVIGGYALASHLHVSGPLAMVTAGLIVGNHGRARAMSDTTRRYVDGFWQLLDSILNAVLFMLIGMEIVLLDLTPSLALAAVATILVTLGARYLTVGVPIHALGARTRLPDGAWKVLTWGGLRGGISVALALSLPVGPARDTVVTLTYAVVVFSILAQGGTMARLVSRQARGGSGA